METDIDNLLTTVYVALLDEGTDVFRPVEAIGMGNLRFDLLRPHVYDEHSEAWHYVPGSVVRCEKQEKDGEQVLIAVERVIV